MFDVSSESSSSCRVCRAVLFNKLVTAKIHAWARQISRVELCRVETWRTKWNLGYTTQWKVEMASKCQLVVDCLDNNWNWSVQPTEVTLQGDAHRAVNHDRASMSSVFGFLPPEGVAVGKWVGNWGGSPVRCSLPRSNRFSPASAHTAMAMCWHRSAGTGAGWLCAHVARTAAVGLDPARCCFDGGRISTSTAVDDALQTGRRSPNTKHNGRRAKDAAVVFV